MSSAHAVVCAAPEEGHFVASAIDAREMSEALDRLAAARSEIPSPVAVAVSGGGDSVGLLHLLLAAGWPPEALRVVHVDHARRPESDREAQFVAALARRLGVPFTGRRLDASTPGDAATLRAARRQVLLECAAQCGAQTIALAHTLDDQQETRLLAMLRGAGLRGLAGMRMRSGPFWRPLLNLRRQTIRSWLLEQRHDWIDDRSNVDFQHLRSRVRHLVLPAVGRPPTAAEAKRVELLQAEDDFLDRQALAGATWYPFGIFDLEVFRALDPVLQRRLLKLWTGPGQGVERLEELRMVMNRPERSRLREVELVGARSVLIGATLAVQRPLPQERLGDGRLQRQWPGIGRLQVWCEDRQPEVALLTLGELGDEPLSRRLPSGVSAPLRAVWPVIRGRTVHLLDEIAIHTTRDRLSGDVDGVRWCWEPASNVELH